MPASPQLQSLVQRWMSDPNFRSEVRRDPDSALQHSGVQLDDDELALVRSIDWQLSDEELTQKAHGAGGM
jgi:hypothetical protein